MTAAYEPFDETAKNFYREFFEKRKLQKVMQAFIERQILFAPGAPLEEIKALVNTYRITAQGYVNYQIPGKLRCPIHLFRAQEQQTGVKFENTREAWGWTECTLAKVAEHWIPGTHVSMMTNPHVKTLADMFQYLMVNGE